jgi:hypothetical protein
MSMTAFSLPFPSPSCLPKKSTAGNINITHVTTLIKSLDVSNTFTAHISTIDAISRNGQVCVTPFYGPYEAITTPHIPISEPPATLCALDFEAAMHIGALIPLIITALFIGPLFWVWRTCHKRVRLIHDMRTGNVNFPTPPHFSLPTIKSTFAPRNNMLPTHATMIDLQHAYWQIPLHPSMYPFFAAASASATSVWTCLPFGWTWSPYIFYLIMSLIISFATHHGVWTSAYMDDIIILGNSESECEYNTKFMLTFLSACGFIINVKKSSLTPSTSIRYLGLHIQLHATHTLVRWPTDKATKVCALAAEMASTKSATPRDLMSVSGRIGFFRSICPLASALTRPIDSFVNNIPLDTTLPLPIHILEALQLITSLCDTLSSSWWLLHSLDTLECIIRVDASADGFGYTINLPDTDPIHRSALLHASLHSASSTLRECFGACSAIFAVLPLLDMSRRWKITLICDNTGVESYLRRGRLAASATSPIFTTLLNEICKYSHILQILPLWNSRTLMTESDTLSRLAASDAALSKLLIAPMLISYFGLDRDLFACHANAQCNVYVSPFPEPFASDYDALRIMWRNGDYAYFPRLHWLVQLCRIFSCRPSAMQHACASSQSSQGT